MNMSMPTFKTTYVFAVLFSSALFLTGCNKDKEPTATTENQTNSSQDAIGQLNQTPIKQFPATADDADTIDISSIISADKIVSASCQAATDGWDPVAAITTAGVLTIPGATDNEARTIYIMARL
jgi:PBP1b-binding outer membrane lipoprotein LpoB